MICSEYWRLEVGGHRIIRTSNVHTLAIGYTKTG
jgi:hypothetical protein